MLFRLIGSSAVFNQTGRRASLASYESYVEYLASALYYYLNGADSLNGRRKKHTDGRTMQSRSWPRCPPAASRPFVVVRRLKEPASAAAVVLLVVPSLLHRHIPRIWPPLWKPIIIALELTKFARDPLQLSGAGHSWQTKRLCPSLRNSIRNLLLNNIHFALISVCREREWSARAVRRASRLRGSAPIISSRDSNRGSSSSRGSRSSSSSSSRGSSPAASCIVASKPPMPLTVNDAHYKTLYNVTCRLFCEDLESGVRIRTN